MRVSCPSCHAEFSLDVLMQHEATRIAFAKLAEMSLPLGALVLRYMALFRPAQRRLSLDRTASLINELLPDMQRRAITRKGRDWDADMECWRAALEAVLAKRDKGTLTLPLTSHGLLYEIVCSLADRHEAINENVREAERRSARPVGERKAAPTEAAKPAADVLEGLKRARRGLVGAATEPTEGAPQP